MRMMRMMTRMMSTVMMMRMMMMRTMMMTMMMIMMKRMRMMMMILRLGGYVADFFILFLLSIFSMVRFNTPRQSCHIGDIISHVIIFPVFHLLSFFTHFYLFIVSLHNFLSPPLCDPREREPKPLPQV